MKNIDEMTSKEMQEFARELEKRAKFKRLLEQAGLNEDDLVPSLIKEAIETNEKVVFNSKILNTEFNYEGKETVKGIAFNGIQLEAEDLKYLPNSFVDDLKKLGIKDFVLCGEIPVRLIKEFDAAGYKLNGLYTGSMLKKATHTGALIGKSVMGVAKIWGQTNQETTEEVTAELKVDNLKEPGLHFVM